MLDLKKLQVFVVLMEQRSFSRTAEICHLSQPTVSGHIKAIESHFDTVLFDRHTREVKPTKAGEFLYRYAKRLVRLAEEVEREMRLFVSGGRGHLLLGGSNIPGHYILPELLGRFKERHPDVDITLEIADSEKITQKVAEGELEAGLVGARIVESELVFEPCFEDEIIFVVPPETAVEAPLSPEALLEFPLVVRERGSGTWFTVQNRLREMELPVERLTIVAEMGSTEAVKQAVKAGMGGAFISRLAVRDELERGSLRHVPVRGLEIRRSFYLITPEKRTLSPLTNVFVDFVRNFR